MLTIISNPSISEYSDLCKRPALDLETLVNTVKDIFTLVQDKGDVGLRELTLKFDGVSMEKIQFDIDTVSMNKLNLESKLVQSIDIAYANIYAFHDAQRNIGFSQETTKGVVCSQKSVPINRVGIYIPGGSAPLFSTVLMLAIPAKIAGCNEIVLCTPPNAKGQIHPAILYCAQLCGISEVHLVGGAQAIAAMAVGTESIKKVDKLFGPGNQYVTAAKQLSQQYGVAIDMPAGPSEVLVYADKTANSGFVAADLLAQAEHGADSQVILVASDVEMAKEVNEAIIQQIKNLPRANVALEALSHSKAIIIEDVKKAFDLVNTYAPEHLIIASSTPDIYIPYIVNAGSVFLGNFCPESAGDYASGTNHTLPTNGWARSYSGVNVDAFMKKITFQSISAEGIKNLGDTIIQMAEAESLQAHANAVKIRLEYLQK